MPPWQDNKPFTSHLKEVAQVWSSGQHLPNDMYQGCVVRRKWQQTVEHAERLRPHLVWEYIIVSRQMRQTECIMVFEKYF